jgi:hypothetical protein
MEFVYARNGKIQLFGLMKEKQNFISIWIKIIFDANQIVKLLLHQMQLFLERMRQW